MSWIKIDKKIKALVFLGCVPLLINHYTFSFFDPNPPLSDLAVYVIFALYLLSFLAVILYLLYPTLLIQLIIATVFLIATDTTMGLIIDRVDHKEFRLEQPQPYANAKYFSLEFIEESFSHGGWILDTTYGGVKPKNYKGKWFNVKENRRVTINGNAEYNQKLYLFGGSTVYNSEVPDALTIASQLANAGANNASFEVVNMGATSIHSTQQLGRLKAEVQLKKDDIVVFYDGVNDVQQRIVYENQEGYMFGQPKHESLVITLLRKVSRHSSISHLLLDQMINNTKKIPFQLIDSSISNYLKTLDETNNYVLGEGADFFHFLQPTLLTKKPLNEYETDLLNAGEPFVPEQSKNAFMIAYPLIEEDLGKVSYSESLTAAFDGLDVSPYLDICHINHVGNAIIAKAIWAKIKGKIIAD